MRADVAGNARVCPSQSHPAYCAAFPGGALSTQLWDTLLQCLGGLTPEGLAYARAVAGLPAAMGGLGLSSAAWVTGRSGLMRSR